MWVSSKVPRVPRVWGSSKDFWKFLGVEMVEMFRNKALSFLPLNPWSSQKGQKYESAREILKLIRVLLLLSFFSTS